jgi:hypothetical protein
MFILQVLFAVFDARDCKALFYLIGNELFECILASGVFLCVTILNIVVIGGRMIYSIDNFCNLIL